MFQTLPVNKTSHCICAAYISAVITLNFYPDTFTSIITCAATRRTVSMSSAWMLKTWSQGTQFPSKYRAVTQPPPPTDSTLGAGETAVRKAGERSCGKAAWNAPPQKQFWFHCHTWKYKTGASTLSNFIWGVHFPGEVSFKLRTQGVIRLGDQREEGRGGTWSQDLTGVRRPVRKCGVYPQSNKKPLQGSERFEEDWPFRKIPYNKYTPEEEFIHKGNTNYL